jgi:peptidoglycan/LPS O-acetylase OafA/YrhL
VPMTKQDLAWGIRGGLAVGGFVAVAALIAATGGGTDDVVSAPGLPSAFLLCGVVGGVMVGMFRHLKRSPWRTALLGAMISLPCYAIIVVFVDGWSALVTEWQILVIAPLTIGPGAGVGLWFLFKSRYRRSAGS